MNGYVFVYVCVGVCRVVVVCGVWSCVGGRCRCGLLGVLVVVNEWVVSSWSV